MKTPSELKYSKEHEWVRLEGNIATVGITDFAQSELGDIVFVDVESNAGEVIAGEVFGSVEAVKTVSDLFSPVTGKIIAFNEKLEDSPESINDDPYNLGWIIKVDVSDVNEIDNLLDSDQYASLVSK